MKKNLAFSQSNNGALITAKNGNQKPTIEIRTLNIRGSLNNILAANEKQDT